MSCARIFPKPLHVGKTDLYGIDKSAWLNGDSIVSFSLTVDGVDAPTASSLSFTPEGYMAANFTGVADGVYTAHFEYATDTARTDCQRMKLVVQSC